MELATDRLLLREFVESDWPAVHEYACDPEVVRFMPWGPNTEEDSRAFVQRAIGHRSQDPRIEHDLAVVLKAEDRLIGGCGLHAGRTEDRAGFLGYCLNPRFWGRGYATEAARALVAFGFADLGLHRVFATCDIGNAASARVLEKVGMQREGLLRDDTWQRGRWRSTFVYAVLEDEWRTP